MRSGWSSLFNDANENVGAKIAGVYFILFLANVMAWLWAAFAFRNAPVLLGTALLAYSLGLRHAVDADHIAAIDNVTRKLMQEGNNNGIDTLDVASGNLAINTNPRNGQPAFNTALFSVPPLGQMGNVPRRFFYGPGLDNFDMALRKALQLTESKSLEFRVEAFNVFNHAQFFGAAAVDGNISSSNFGRIVNADAPRQMQLAAKFYF